MQISRLARPGGRCAPQWPKSVSFVSLQTLHHTSFSLCNKLAKVASAASIHAA
uniref:Uncharacterized protein n=1 Tax=Anguilla anguilla TaxID=7936 RepID=A0A0E9RUF6_ANGAN